MFVVTFLIGYAPPGLAADTLPGWDGRDIGEVGQPGTAFFNETTNTFVVEGAGADIWGGADAFHFVSRQLLGLGFTTTLIARVTAEQNTNAFAKAGLMIRTSYDPSAAHVILDIKPNGEIEFMSRSQPGGDTVFVAGTSATIQVFLRLMYDGQTVIGSVSADGVTWSVVGSANLAGGLYGGMAVTSHDPSVVNQALFDNVQSSFASNDGFPNGWAQIDLGATALTGTASYANGTFTISGAGADIWGTSDSFTYLYDLVNSPPNAAGLNGTEITAHVTSIQETDPFAKAGVMMRASLDPAATNVVLDVKPDGEVEFMARTSAGAPTMFLAGGALPPTSAWLRLTLFASVATAYISSDGVNWSHVAEIAIPLATDHYSGLAVTSHDTRVINTATFDNVLVGWSSQDIGNVGVPGSIAVENLMPSRVIVGGAGSDIWGTTDAFHFIYRPLTLAGPGPSHSIIVALDSLQNTNPFAKAGVMIRDSLDPTSAQVILDVKPDGAVEFMSRSAAGASTTFIAGGAYPFNPAFTLLLVMQGQTFSGYVCQTVDGFSCSLIGTTTASISPDGFIGLAVTSHDPTVATKGVFRVPTVDVVFPR